MKKVLFINKKSPVDEQTSTTRNTAKGRTLMNLSVIIPAYNEEQRLLYAISKIHQFLKSEQISHEIIVVNDGSTDGTSKVTDQFRSQSFPVQLIELTPNQGKGKAVKTGILKAEGDLILFTDADQSTPIEELSKLLKKIENENYDIAIGSRALKESDMPEGQKWYRQFAAYVFTFFTKMFVLKGIQDTQCGFKLMKHSAGQDVFKKLSSSTAIFDIEMLLLSTMHGYTIAEVPIKWTHDPDTRIPYNLYRSIKIFQELFRIKWHHKIKRSKRAITTH